MSTNYSVINNSLKYYETDIIKGKSLLNKEIEFDDSLSDKNPITILGYLKSKGKEYPTMKDYELCETV